MNNLPEENDDRCQHPQGCSRSLFTYCPHCHLFLCMTHLNEHHDLMKTEWSQILHDVKHQKTIVEEQIKKLNEQKEALKEIFEREIENLNIHLTLITNLCQIQSNDKGTHPLTNGYEKRIEQLNAIKQTQIPRAEAWIRHIEELLQQHTPDHAQLHNNKTEQEISSTLDIVPIVDDDSIEVYSDSTDGHQDESNIDSNVDEKSFDQHDESDKKPSLQSTWSSESFNCPCPLTHLNAFGLTSEHSVPGTPCDLNNSTTNMPPNRCYYHLITYHHLKPKVARMIMDFLSSKENRSRDLTKVDLFSKLPAKEVVSQSIGLYVRLCPLTIEKIYGLESGEDFVLCKPRTPVHLEQHLRTVHHFKQNCAKRLIKALIDGEPFTKEVFSPNENVIDSTLRSKSRKKRQSNKSLRHSRTSR